MSGSGSGPLQPTWNGFVQNSMDGLMLFEACLSGKLHHVPRRPHDRERSSLIKSGSVFIYEENASGIKRWTDGVAWSPSRILGNFLIYRELEKPFPPGEKKRAMKRKRSQELDGRRDSEDHEPSEYATAHLPPTPPSPATNQPESKPESTNGQDNDKEMERQLIGSLVDSYGFRPNGLVKKTMSISLNGVSHHLVSYYTVEDVKQRRLNRPLSDSRLAHLTVRPDLFLKQNFRAPVEETEHYAVDAGGQAYPHMVYSPMVAGAYALRPGGYGVSGYPMYGVSTAGPMYSALPATAWPTTSQSTVTAGGYSSHGYPPGPSYDYYNRNPSSSTPQSAGGVKQEGPAPSPSYMSYPSSYQSSMRSTNGTGTYPPMQSAYQPQQSPSSSSAYGGPPPASSAPSQAPISHSANPAPQGYSSTPTSTHPSAQQQYHTGSYGVSQSSGSPHSSMKSPVQTSNHALGSITSRTSLPSSIGTYQGSYTGQEGQPASNMSMGSTYGGNTSAGPPPAYGSSGYGPTYGNQSQNFRPSSDGGAGVPTTGYT